jgi:hypothetical protein
MINLAKTFGDRAQSISFDSNSRPRGENLIEVNIDTLDQLFNTMDPSPFHERDLDRSAEEFVVSWAREYPLHEPVRLIVHLKACPPGIDAQAVIERAVHNYFGYKTALNEREFGQLLREGRISLLIGLSFLTLCLSAGEFVVNHNVPGGMVIRESLTIGGWVAMWYPLEIYLYRWWPLRRTGRIFRKLGEMPVEVRCSDVLVPVKLPEQDAASLENDAAARKAEIAIQTQPMDFIKQ